MKHGTALLLSTGMMLATLSAAKAGTPDALIQAHHQRCGKPVFAQTANHKKEVEICIITPSVSYSFGKTGAEHKEMDITVPTRRHVRIPEQSGYQSAGIHCPERRHLIPGICRDKR
jgi:cellobiose-specific phosphotransferase system component IIB